MSSFREMFANELESQAQNDFMTSADKEALVASGKTFTTSNVVLNKTRFGDAWTVEVEFSGNEPVPEGTPTKMTLSSDPGRDPLMNGIVHWIAQNNKSPEFKLEKLGRKYVLVLADDDIPF